MGASIQRVATSFRLRKDLLDGLRQNAERENRTLSNYVESVLLDAVYNQPNAETLAAMEEMSSANFSGKTYSSAQEMLNDILAK